MKSIFVSMVNKRCRFTMLEMLVALAILAIVGSALAVSFGRLLDQQRFRTTVSSVVEVLQQAQEIHLLYDTDVTVDLRLAEGVLQAKVAVDKPLPFKIPVREMRGVQSFSFDGVPLSQIKLEFFSSGSHLPRGNLALWSRGGEGRWVSFSGYLAPIKEVSRAVDLPIEDPTESYERYPKELI